jgi:hypothetical protein
LTWGVVVGITITARVPSLLALKATPWAWLPADAQITPFLQLFRAQVRHLVVCAAQLEAANGLMVFALEQHGVVQAFASGFGGLQRGFTGHIVDTGRQDLLEVVRWGQVWAVGSRHGG